MNQLTVTFAGICTHFDNVVSGIPHRVVLPNASPFYFDIVRMPPSGLKVGYYVQPHYAILQTSTVNPSPTVDNVMANGYFYAGALLDIPNAIGDLTIDKATYFDGQLKSLRDFVPEFIPSQDVVVNRRAACYFDFQHGTIAAVSAAGGAINVVITVQTGGPPQLTLTPFETDVPVDISDYLEIDGNGNAAITVANIEFDTSDEDVPFDYMLHYLTAQRGVPPALSAKTPGMGAFTQLTKDMLEGALRSLATMIAVDSEPAYVGPTAEHVMRFNADLVDPSCSDSRYP
jgi:hypothetical protein